MAKDKTRVTKKGVTITAEEYKQYQKIRRNRAKTIRQARDEMVRSLNLDYSDTIIPKRQKERKGKRFTIEDFRSRFDFEQFMKYGDRYSDFEIFKEKRARDYYYHMKQAFTDLSSDDPIIIKRFDDITNQLNGDYYILEEIYSENEELDLSFVYVDTKQGNYERLTNALDILEKKVNEKLKKED